MKCELKYNGITKVDRKCEVHYGIARKGLSGKAG